MTYSVLRKPSALPIFFITEMWERYGFYVVQSLLALYLAITHQWPDKRIYALVGSFTAITYLSPVVGGFIADNLLGQKRAILTGAVCLFLSYITLACVTSEVGFLGALAGIAVGTGLLKPNISSLLGNEYPRDSPRRERGFTIFYMGITSGIILGTTIPSQLTHHYGWAISFMSAALGMVIAFLVFLIGIKRYQIGDYHPINDSPSNRINAGLLILILWLLSFSILKNPRMADAVFGMVVIIACGYLLHAIKFEPAKQAKQTAVIGLLCIISIMFWAFYFQMFLSLTLFMARAVTPTLLGLPFPPPYYVSVQSIGMLIFGYYLTVQRPRQVSTPQGIKTGNKFVLAMVLILMAYVIIGFICYRSQTNTLLSPGFFIPAYLLISMAELLLSPVGLAAITQLASPRNVSTMMGLFFVSLGIGGYLSGKLASMTAIDSAIFSSPNAILLIKAHYADTFGHLVILLSIAVGSCWLLNKFIKRLLLPLDKTPKICV
jgi:POT family proton-dependent oligopeptide transporter